VPAAPLVLVAEGRAENAHSCLHDGWRVAVRGDNGGGFTSQGECVSCGAKGGGIAAAMSARATHTAANPRKISICHATGSPDHPWQFIDVAEPAWAAHAANGDTSFINCCSDADGAPVDACTPAVCHDGACNQVSTGAGAETRGGGGIPGACGAPVIECLPFTTWSGDACIDPCSSEGACDGCGYCNATAASEAICPSGYRFVCSITRDSDADYPGAYPSCLAWPGSAYSPKPAQLAPRSSDANHAMERTASDKPERRRGFGRPA
jgi:hypothetical protein